MTSRLLDARRTLIIALSVIAGMAVEVFPSITASAPLALRPLVGSSLVLATVVALALNLFVPDRSEEDRQADQSMGKRMTRIRFKLFQTQGGKWGARPTS